MKDLRLLYVHGYLGKGNGRASKLIKAELDKRQIRYTLDAPQFPVMSPSEMQEMLSRLMKDNDYDCVIASSLGGFYVMQSDAKMKMLVNPGLPENQYSLRNSGSGEKSDLTDELLNTLEELKTSFFENRFNEDEVAKTYFAFGSRDTIAPNEAFFKQHYTDSSHMFNIDMEHRLDEKGAEIVGEVVENVICGRDA